MRLRLKHSPVVWQHYEIILTFLVVSAKMTSHWQIEPIPTLCVSLSRARQRPTLERDEVSSRSSQFRRRFLSFPIRIAPRFSPTESRESIRRIPQSVRHCLSITRLSSCCRRALRRPGIHTRAASSLLQRLHLRSLFAGVGPKGASNPMNDQVLPVRADILFVGASAPEVQPSDRFPADQGHR